MSDVRFELKNIPDGMRDLTAHEKKFVQDFLSKSLSFTDMSDHLVPDRVILATNPRIPARLLGGSLGIGGEHLKNWTEREFDLFFEENFAEGCYLWVESIEIEQTFEPLFWAPYSPERRDWLYVYGKVENGGLPCGMTSVDGRISMFSELDSDFTIVFGDPAAISSFDAKFGGKKQICDSFRAFLASKQVDFGQGNIYGYLEVYLPKLGGCDE